MAKVALFLAIILGVWVTQNHAVSVVNNVTVPSDVLTRLFLNSVQNNKVLLDAPTKRNSKYDSLKCISAIEEIVNRLPKLEVLPFIDSWGRLPSGLLYGHLQDLGNFDQCVRTAVNLNEVTSLVRGQYCFASVPLIENMFPGTPEGPEGIVETTAYADLLRIKVGICVPDSCEPSLLTEIFQAAANNTFGDALSGIKVSRCKTAERPKMEAINIVGIVIFSIFGALLVLSTAYDAYTVAVNRKAVPTLLAFSVLTNGRKLFAINTTKSPLSIDCLTGIRVLSMVWVVYCHNYSLTPMLPLINFIDMAAWIKKASTMHIVMATVSVDTFLFISGLLVAWLGFRELEKRNGKLDVPLMYFHRYLRLTPPVAAVMLYFLSINQFVGTGPQRDIFETFNAGCEKNWWSTLLYVQNYVNPDLICVPQSWYLAVDTQLYILSPLVLIPLWKWGRKFAPVMIVLSLLSIGCVIATFFAEGYNQFIGVLGENQNRYTYVPTHTRYSVWMVGVGLGYFMFKNRNKTFFLSKLVQIMAWILSFTVILAIIYGPYFTINADRATTVFEAAMYESLRRVSWAIVLSWIVFACHFGFGGVINDFLSHPYWQPIGRLTFSLYLVHMAVQSAQYGSTKTDAYFSDYNEILFFWGTFGVSLCAAIVLALTFESPILVIEKALLGKNKEKKRPQSENVDAIKVTCTEPSQKIA